MKRRNERLSRAAYPMKRVLATLAIPLVMTLAAPPALAQRSLPLIRDAEIERIIREYGAPIFRAAGVAPGSIKVHIVNLPQINAFVAGGAHIFINTGLLMRAKDPNVIVGVLAHETGHIIGNHLSRLRDALRDAQIQQILTFILAGAAAAASGDGRFLGAGVSLGQRIVAGNFFRYTRSMETEADNFALKTLKRMGVSARGLGELLETLSSQEALLSSMQDPYLRSHPLTQDRLSTVRRHILLNERGGPTSPPALKIKHARLRAKLIGFLINPARVREIYRGREKSIPARYAIAVSHHRDARTHLALKIMDGLIREKPNDPFFHELKGQLLLESSKAVEAVSSYQKAARLAPNEPLILSSLAHAQLESGLPGASAAALRNLLAATARDKNHPISWRLLGVAYGKQRRFGLSSLSLAEYYKLIGDKKSMYASIIRANKYLKVGSSGWRRLNDLKGALKYKTRRGKR